MPKKKARDAADWNNKGIALKNLGKYDEAIKCYDKAIKINPNNDKAWDNKGIAFGNLGKYDEAIKCYDKAIKINPNNDKAWYNKAIALKNLGKYDEAIKCYDKAIKINPNDDKAWYNKAIALDDLGKYDEAIKCYDKAIKINPNNDKAWNNKGIALDDLGKYDEAIKCYDKAIKINPNKDNAWYNKAIAFGNLGKYDEAIKCYDKAIKINPNDESAWNNKGIALYNLGKYDEAIKCYDKAIKINPNKDKAWNNKGIAFGNLGKHDEAIKCFAKAVDINPNYVDAWHNKGVALANLGKHDEAIKCYARAHLLSREIPVGEYRYALETARVTRPEETQIEPQFIEDTKRDRVRVSLVQLNFSLELNRPPEDFGYTLKEKTIIKKKVFRALSIAKKNEVNIICFPELSTAKEWIEEVKTQFKDMIIVFGTYYENGFNVCPILVNQQDYYIRKINPSPHFETEVVRGRRMKKGKKIFIFQTKYGKFAVFICMDYKKEVNRVLFSQDKGISDVDFIIVPQFNRAIRLFQEHGNWACQENSCPYILHVNALKVLDQEIGRTCVIGMDHKNALKRYEMADLKPKDDIQYKLTEINDEGMIIVDLDIKKKGVILPASNPKMIFIGHYTLA